MSNVEKTRSVEEVRADIDATFLRLQEDLEYAGDPDTGPETKRRAFNEHMTPYAKLVFELAELIGGQQALQETAKYKVWIHHKYRSGTTSSTSAFYLNEQKEFLAVLMDIALGNKNTPKTSQPISTEGTRSSIIDVTKSADA